MTQDAIGESIKGMDMEYICFLIPRGGASGFALLSSLASSEDLEHERMRDALANLIEVLAADVRDGTYESMR